MISILGRARIEDLPKFLGVFATRGAQLRRQHGALAAEVFRVSEQDDEVVLLFRWSSRQDFEGFLADPAVRAAMAASGTLGKPEFTFLEPVAALPG